MLIMRLQHISDCYQAKYPYNVFTALILRLSLGHVE